MSGQQVVSYTFSLRRADSLQSALMAHLRTLGAVIVDKSKDMAAQAAGYDFLLNGEPAEFKFDTRMSVTGNLAVEIVSNIGRGKPGWFITSQARWLFYLDTCLCTCYQIDLQALRQALDSDNRNRYSAAKARTENKYSTLNWLVEIGFARATGCIVCEYSFNCKEEAK